MCTVIACLQAGIPGVAGKLRGALEGLHAHVQEQLDGVGGHDTRMAALLRQLGEQEAEQQVGALFSKMCVCVRARWPSDWNKEGLAHCYQGALARRAKS